MTNYNKSFSFKNGIQVDNSNFVINPNGLVGIGTSIPRELLDILNGTVKVSGLVTTTNLYVTGFSTFYEVRVGNNIKISSPSGIITATAFYGNGATLSNLPTSQWVDIDVGLGFTSIYNAGYVGIVTNDPRYFLQIGGNPNNSQSGVGINSVGDIKATGIITASYFSGNGASLTGLNASNIASGTIGNSYLPTIDNNKLPSNISVSGIITASTYFSGIASGNLIGNVYSTGLSTFSGGIIGDVTGTASTARGLTGTPNIVVGLVTASSVQSTSLFVGSSGTVFSVTNTGNVGIGTSIPTSDIQIKKESPLVEIVSTSGQARVSIGQSVGVGNSTAVLRFGNSSKTFDIINNDTGNINMYLQNGSAGIDTGRFAWIHGILDKEIASLTYDGKFGIGKTNPDHPLHVVGTSTITSNLYIGGNIEINGSFSFGTGPNRSLLIPGGDADILQNVNLNVTSGVSTVANILVSPNSSIGIGTTSAIVGIDARQSTALINKLGIGTDNTQFLSNLLLYNKGSSAFKGQVGIGTTTIDTVDGSYLLVNSGNVKIDGNNKLIITGYGGIGINTSWPWGAIDMRLASLDATYRAPLYPPILTTSERNTLVPLRVGAGAVIYNSTDGNHQAYDGSSWGPLGLTGTPDITVGTANVTTLKVGTGVTSNSGIVTAMNGFSSGIGTAVKITTVGNKLTFTVPGVGTTTLTLY